MPKPKEGERVTGIAGFSFGELLGGFLGAGAGGGSSGGATPEEGYSWQLEAGLALVLKDMSPSRKLALARRMMGIFRELEADALKELGASAEPAGG